jgi:hypothetical protein
MKSKKRNGQGHAKGCKKIVKYCFDFVSSLSGQMSYSHGLKGFSLI